MALSTRRLISSSRRSDRLRATVFDAQFVQQFQRVARFGLVGILGVLVNMLALYLLVEAAGVNRLAAAALASEVSILGNFMLNDRWTFGDSHAAESSWLWRGMRYNLVALGGMGIALAVIAALTSLLGMHYLLANLFAIGVSTASNYSINSRFTWTLPRAAQRMPRPVGLKVLTLVPVRVSSTLVELKRDRPRR